MLDASGDYLKSRALGKEYLEGGPALRVVGAVLVSALSWRRYHIGKLADTRPAPTKHSHGDLCPGLLAPPEGGRVQQAAPLQAVVGRPDNEPALHRQWVKNESASVS